MTLVGLLLLNNVTEVSLYCDPPVQTKSLYLPVKIDHLFINAVVDTAAQVSVLNSKSFQDLFPCNIAAKDIFLKGIKKGMPESLFGETHSITNRRLQYRIRFGGS